MRAKRIFMLTKSGLGALFGVLLFLGAPAQAASQSNPTSGSFRVKINVIAKCDVSPTAVGAAENTCRNEVLHQTVLTPVERSQVHVVTTTAHQEAQVYRVTVVF